MILITGATGYIGRHLVSRLVDQGPRCLVRNTSRAASILPADKVELVEGGRSSCPDFVGRLTPLTFLRMG